MFKYTQVPEYRCREFQVKLKDYCVCIPVINEGERIQKQLQEMKKLHISDYADIIICDGGSTDNSLEESFLTSMNISVLLTKVGPGKLSAQLRMGYYYAIVKRGYKGIITIDGNNKDKVAGILGILEKLKQGNDFVQGSRFVSGGEAINTPFMRLLAVKMIHIPVISFISKFKYTDTTNGFRGYSAKMLSDHRIEPFRDVFKTYELIGYLSVKAPLCGYQVVECPVVRAYPFGKVPTKISPLKGNLDLLKILYRLYRHDYDPK